MVSVTDTHGFSFEFVGDGLILLCAGAWAGFLPLQTVLSLGAVLTYALESQFFFALGRCFQNT